MLWILAATMLLALLPFPPRALAQLAQPIQIEGGAIRGLPSAQPGVEVFKDIPFAAPPVGDLRWRAPQPVVPWRGIRAADHFSPACMQQFDPPRSVYFSGYETMSEDCLYLNLWTPARSATERHAVMVWIYGGGFVQGSAAQRFYNGAALAAKGVVVVSINYRVGVFGFLAHPELSAESGHGSGDYGFLDQVAALHWVHDNIAHFGGDPTRVTVFGQSAGGSSAGALVASPLAKGLITGAISESGQIIWSPDFQIPLATAEANGVVFAKSLGASSIAELRKLPAQQLLNTPTRFRVDVDGYFLPATGAEIYASGKENHVPALMGSNANESHSRTTLARFRADAEQQFGSHAAEFLALYPASNDAEASVAFSQSHVDEYAFSEWEYAKIHTVAGHSRAYLYHFSHKPPIPPHMYSMENLGAYHGAEIPYVFDHLRMRPWVWTETDRRLAHTISSYWVNFAKTGNPNGPGLPEWPAFNPAHQHYMSFTDEAQSEPESAALLAKFHFFEANRTLLYPPK